MRVISGKARGCKLIAPAGDDTRPTADRMKESLFNMLAEDIPGACFLDLFSGTGAIGIEALSRGAKRAVFVERDKACAEIIRKNLAHTKLVENAQVICADFLDALKGQNEKAFDIIFMDPPYAKGFPAQALSAIVENGVLKDGGLVVVEQAAFEALPQVDKLDIIKQKKYKTACFVFLEGKP